MKPSPDTLRECVRYLDTMTPRRIRAHAAEWEADLRLAADREDVNQSFIEQYQVEVADLRKQLEAADETARAEFARGWEEGRLSALAAHVPCPCGREGSLDHEDFCDPLSPSESET